MQFKDYIKTTCRESSIHGLPYVEKQELHWSERLFWGATIIAATYFSVNICLNQWERFRDSPIVYAMERIWGITDFHYAGITLCSDFYNQEDTEAVIENIWNVKPEDAKFQYYLDFLFVLNVLRFDTLGTLKPYANDTTVQKVDFLKILLAMQQRIMPRVNDNSDGDNPKLDLGDLRQMYAASISEAGLCRTTSQLSEYTNPYGKLKRLPVSNTTNCGYMNECNSKIFPMVNDKTNLRIYLYNVLDVVSPNDRSTIIKEAKPHGSLNIELLLGWTMAEAEVRNLPIDYRKCRYPDENNLEYFKIYRPSLCRIECHINHALAMCHCKPYFYAVAPHAPICDIKGMLCLDKSNWLKASCKCVPLCEEISYTNMQSTEQTGEASKFERTIIVNLFPPRMALKRRVVFSTDQLIVSFGGAFGLFLGASFISVYGLIYLFTEYLIANCKACCSKRKKGVKVVRMVKAV